MNDAEKKAYSDGYRRALREALQDVADVHRLHAADMPVRKVADLVWARIKVRLNLVKAREFNFDGS